jgi:hypothetical protein
MGDDFESRVFRTVRDAAADVVAAGSARLIETAAQGDPSLTLAPVKPRGG